MLKLRVLSVLGSLLFSVTALAHGEDKPGPNGGEIRMPGGFHTELIENGNEFQVRLLDLTFKDPQTKDSSVALKVVRSGVDAPIEFACVVTTNSKGASVRSKSKSGAAYFKCTSAGYKGHDGDVVKVLSKRLGSEGVEVDYKLPLLKAAAAQNPAKQSAPKATSGHDHGHGHTDQKQHEHGH